MEGLTAVGWINSKLEISHKIILAINTPEKTGSDRKKWMELIVSCPLNESSKIIASLISQQLLN